LQTFQLIGKTRRVGKEIERDEKEKRLWFSGICSIRTKMFIRIGGGLVGML